ncbi:MAG TPA: NADP-dependent oxidoreductase [Thermoleophilaceae bacterium]|nr:NADP-dependent oxidoreductase [Thermoleophilaceae bacterium]
MNRQLRLAKRPVGEPTPDDFEITEEDTPAPGDDEVLVKVLQISLDPAMRGWMSDAPSYLPPVGLGDVMRAGTSGVVVESNSDRFGAGDHVVGTLGVQEQAVVVDKALTKVDTDMAPLATFLGGLGMPGLTGYFGLTEVGDLREGDTVVISGAAGAVGSVGGQVAKAKGAGLVVGIAGGPEKCQWLVDDLGFDAAIDYKSEKVGRRLHELCPDGINVYFDNVGGDILDAALANLAWGARVVICGAISQYNAEGGMQGPRNYMMLLVRRARMQGFLVFDYVKQYGDALREMAQWRAEGKLKTREEIVAGSIEDFQPTLMKLFRGENTGKLVLEIAAT